MTQLSANNIGGGTNDSNGNKQHHINYIQNQDLMGLGSDGVGSPHLPNFTPLRGELVLDDDDYEDYDHQMNDER